jgi:hypothetical protein
VTEHELESDLRAERRRRTLKGGAVVLSDWSTIDCVIRDISATGARLRFMTVTRLPDTFGVMVVGEALVYPAERRWVRGTDVGVRFIGPPRPTARQLVRGDAPPG